MILFLFLMNIHVREINVQPKMLDLKFYFLVFREVRKSVEEIEEP